MILARDRSPWHADFVLDRSEAKARRPQARQGLHCPRSLPGTFVGPGQAASVPGGTLRHVRLAEVYPEREARRATQLSECLPTLNVPARAVMLRNKCPNTVTNRLPVVETRHQ